MTFPFFQTFIITASLCMASIAPAQEAPPPADEKPAQSPPSSSGSSGKTLDDLLGTGGDESHSQGEQAAEEERRQALEQLLSEEQVSQIFEEILRQMDLSAKRLSREFDPGIGTQRIQEDILAKLNALINQADQQASQQSSSSSSSSSQQQQQQRNNPQPNQQQQSSQNQQNQPGQQDNQGEVDPPPLQEGDVNTLIDETRIEWGNLPARVREQLLQGRQDKFSSMYQRMTEEYYKRLAEENAP